MRSVTENFAIVLAGGGERVIAWETGVLAGLAARGTDPRRAETVIGTSAGALVAARVAARGDPRVDAARLAAGRDPRLDGAGAALSPAAATFARLAALWAATPGSDTERRRRIGALALQQGSGCPERLIERVRRRLPEGPWPAALQVAAVDAVTGERVALTAADGVPVACGVAASRAIPAVNPPVPVNGRCLIDGAVGSATNADLALTTSARTVIVIASFGLALWAAALDREVQALQTAGRRVVVIRPSEADQTAMGPDPMSAATAPRAVAAGMDAAAA
jgi:NTE family protein